MTKRLLIGLLSIFVLAGLTLVGVFAYQNLRGAIPAILPPSGDIAASIDQQNNLLPGENMTDFPLEMADGFQISVFAKDVPNARTVTRGPKGDIWVAQTKDGIVRRLHTENGVVQSEDIIFQDLNHPHGLLFDPNDPYILYIAEEDAVSRVRVYSDEPIEKMVDLPTGGRHHTRSLAFANDGTLLVSIGSSCDTCYEDDARRGSVQAVRERYGDWVLEPYVTGLRNAVFMAREPRSGNVWVTEMGRDLLGDDLPPDEINILEEGKNYGWPICYGQAVHDTEFDTNTYIRNPCEDTVPAYIDLPAHVAPLGLAFIPSESAWPKEYWGDLLVAEHGSWNRPEPVGYKIVRFDLDERGNIVGQEDFVSGWLDDGRALGRPVDLLASDDGTLLVSDDKAGLVYKVTYSESALDVDITSFQECIDAGNPVMESYPRRCQASGQTFVEDIGNELEKRDLIRIESPRPNTEIRSPLEISGEARGTWYFEATFPIEIRDANGMVIAEYYATAEDDWMTENFVRFSAPLTFTDPKTETGELILHKSNPSGLPENADTFRIPIRFSSDGQGNGARVNGGCSISGCSGEVCSDADVVTTCVYKEAFACYNSATCERQDSGECGWTQTGDLTICLSQYE